MGVQHKRDHIRPTRPQTLRRAVGHIAKFSGNLGDLFPRLPSDHRIVGQSTADGGHGEARHLGHRLLSRWLVLELISIGFVHFLAQLP